jgi:peptide/nickel transport system ATP-binding protein
MGLLMPPLVLQRGEIIFEQENLISLSQSRLQNIRGKRIGMVFQEPLNAFNPVFTIGSQISEVLKIHLSLSPAVRQSRVLELLDLVGLQDPRRVERSYPHQLSGGMRQRAMIAQAIAADPALLIADEPTSNLDVTLQAKVMELFEDLRQKLKLSIFLISHDLGMVKHIASDLIVMKSGEIVEQGTTLQVTSSPRGEYTRQLLQAFR